MEEIYSDIPDRVKQNAEFIFDLAIHQKTPMQMLRILNEYTKTCINDYERDFVIFYFNLKMEQMQ